jgi:hypothetical protein
MLIIQIIIIIHFTPYISYFYSKNSIFVIHYYYAFSSILFIIILILLSITSTIYKILSYASICNYYSTSLSLHIISKKIIILFDLNDIKYLHNLKIFEFY